MAILGCFTAARPVMGIADIADELGMSRSTTHRYVITLVALVLYRQVPDVPAIIGLGLIVAGVAVLNIFSKMQAH